MTALYFSDCIAILAACFLLLLYVSSSQSAKRLPPGPKGIPVFGNLFQLPALRPYPKCREWAQQYGEIFYLKLGPQDVVVVNSAEAADELLANRSKIYSSRASPHVAQEIVSDSQRQVLRPYDALWKTMRKSLTSSLGQGSSRQLRGFQELESRAVLYDMLCHGDQSVTENHVEGPDGEIPERHWFAIIRRYTSSVALHIAYGIRVERLYGHPRLHEIYDVVAAFSRAAQPGAYLADLYPFLRKLPDWLAPWRIEANKMHEREMTLWGGIFDESRAATKKGAMRSGFVNAYLRARAEAGQEHAPGSGLTDDGWMRDKALIYTATGVLEAGSDTTAGTMQSFVLFMLSNPHVLRRAKEEIDTVVGEDRMPTFEDEPKLPYVVACIKETMRRRPAIPMGVPHEVEEDDVYNGYLIPKGTSVIGNVWAINMDPKRFYNPTAFDPERFYVKGQPTRWASGPDSNRDHYDFGWGRRFCQGSFVAEASLFIVLSRMLWGIDFSAPMDPRTGQPLLPDMADQEMWSLGFISVPHIFPVRFAPRSEKHADIIRKSFDMAQAEWPTLGLAVDER